MPNSQHLIKTVRPVLTAFMLAGVLTVAGHIKPAQADLGAAASSVPAADLVGQGRLTFLGFKVFDAELYAPRGRYSPSKPFALKLTYLRNFKGSAIAERSAAEMAKQGGVSKAQLAAWTRKMTAIFPNVSAGQTITGVKTAKGSSVFYSGNRKLGTIKDPAFSQRFFSIWLGNRTQNPRLRARLVGTGS